VLSLEAFQQQALVTYLTGWIMTDLCYIYIHKENKHIFDNLTEAQFYNKLSYYCSQQTFFSTVIISQLNSIDTIPPNIFSTFVVLTMRSYIPRIYSLL